jgi:class 3 adenylate cyclase
MAFFNAPEQFVDFPCKTIQCAIDQQKALKSLNTKLKQNGLPVVVVRMATHIGEVYAGNVGSNLRMKYGLVGDPVNLTSR